MLPKYLTKRDNLVMKLLIYFNDEKVVKMLVDSLFFCYIMVKLIKILIKEMKVYG